MGLSEGRRTRGCFDLYKPRSGGDRSPPVRPGLLLNVMSNGGTPLRAEVDMARCFERNATNKLLLPGLKTRTASLRFRSKSV
jgi:hypothetical protein